MKTIDKLSTAHLKRTHKRYRDALEEGYQIAQPTRQDERGMEMLRADIFTIERELLSRGAKNVPFLFKH